MLTRLRQVVKFLNGEFIVLKVEKDTVVVDAGKHSKDDIKCVASVFFKSAYLLGNQ